MSKKDSIKNMDPKQEAALKKVMNQRNDDLDDLDDLMNEFKPKKIDQKTDREKELKALMDEFDPKKIDQEKELKALMKEFDPKSTKSNPKSGVPYMDSKLEKELKQAMDTKNMGNSKVSPPSSPKLKKESGRTF